MVHFHLTRQRERGRQARELLPFPCLGEKPPHGEAPRGLLFLSELSDGVPVRRAMTAPGLGEEAEAVIAKGQGQGLLGVVEVRQAEQLTAERVADKPRDLRDRLSGHVPKWISAVTLEDGGCGADVDEVEEEEAVGAHSADVGKEHAHDLSVDTREWPRSEEVGGDKEAGGAWGLDEVEGRTERRQLDQTRADDHTSLRV